MKRLLLPIITVLFSCLFNNTQAQYVTIPDATFVSWLNSNGFGGCLNGNQLDTTCSEGMITTTMNCNSVAIQDLTGIQYFTSLTTLDCSSDNLNFIPAFPPLLTSINCSYNVNLDSLPALPDSLIILLCNMNLPAGLRSLPALPSTLQHLECEATLLDTLPPLPASLNYLDCYESGTQNMPLLPAGLTYLECANNNIDSLPPLPAALNYLSCGSNHLRSLPTLPANLSRLACGGNALYVLQPLPAGLTYLECADDSLTVLPSLPSSISELFCYWNPLTALPTLPAALIYLDCEYSNLTSFPAWPSGLNTLYCNGNPATSLPTLPAALMWLNCSYDHLVSLPALPAGLVRLECENNNLTSIPALPDSLTYFYCDSNPITCLPQLKRIVNFSYAGTALDCLPDYGQIDNSNPPLYSLPLCDAINTHACPAYWSIGGQSYYDANNNCVFDNGDVGNQYIKLQLYNGSNLIQQVYSDTGGVYSFGYVALGGYTVQVDTSNLPFVVSCPANGIDTLTLTAADSLSYNNNFAFKCRTVGIDVGVNSIINGYIAPRPNTSFTLSTVAGDMSQLYGAHCATGINGDVQITYSGPVTYIGPAVGALQPFVVGGNSITWNISDYGTVNDFTAFNLLFKIDSLAVPGTPVCFTVSVTPTAGDYNPSNNTLSYCFPVVASLDPNEKEVYPTQVDTGGWLTYTIRFQNTGTASALNVRVVDTLSANLDASTFQLLTYSARNLTQIFGDVVIFNFPNINLPDSTTSDSASRGFVQYKIKVKSGVTNGTAISNQASIYFDSNTPVVTNTVTDSVLSCATTYASLNDSICSGDTVYVGTHAYCYTGNYVDTLSNVSGCDSIVTLQLSVTTFVFLNWNILIHEGYLLSDFDESGETGACGDGAGYIPLTGGIPVGGVYSGQRVMNDTLFYDYAGGYDTVYYSYSNAGCSATVSNVILFDICLGINNVTLNDALALYPNPTTDLIYIKTEGIQPQTTNIYDVNGQLVSTMRFVPQVDVSNLAPGVYLMEVSAPEGEAKRRFVKNP